jgi:ATP-dependent helicase/nuclease subunit A
MCSEWAEHYRDRLALRVWVEETWLRLGAAGDPVPTQPAHARCDAEQFLQVVEDAREQRHGAVTRALRIEQLKDAVDLYAAPGDGGLPRSRS